MVIDMSRDVFFLPLETDASALAPPDLRPGLGRLARALDLADPTGTWALKVHLGAARRPAAVDPVWSRTVAGLLAGDASALPRAGTFAFDTLSITTAGLDQAGTHLDLARAKGYAAPDDPLPFRVADGPDQGTGLEASLPPESELSEHTLAGGLRHSTGLCVLTPVRPHPHIGLRGALTTMGVGLADRAAKIALHRDVRPQVDTPLCAGCGVCLTVCLFDAIGLNAGRAMIDHRKCTGCGECMNVCFMAGIGPEESAGIPCFQAKVADAAWAARRQITGGRPDRAAYFSFLIRLDRQAGGARTRDRKRLGDVGVLAARDPVALDQATTDLISERVGGKLADWSGFTQSPEVMLARAEAVGLGRRTYRLVTV